MLKAYGIKASNTMNDAGIYSEEIPFFAGIHIFKADNQVIEKLSENKNLLGKDISFSTAFRIHGDLKLHWCIELLHNGLFQWIKKDLRKKALKAIDDTAFYPEKGRDRIKSMIETQTRLVYF